MTTPNTQQGGPYKVEAYANGPATDYVVEDSDGLTWATFTEDNTGAEELRDLLNTLALSSQSPGGEKPTGTIFELDMFREKLAREAGVRRRVAKSYHDGDPIFQTMLAWSAQLDEFAAELKTLIDNCQKQYCSQSPGGRKGDGEGGAASPAQGVPVESVEADARVAVTDCYEAMAALSGPVGRARLELLKDHPQHNPALADELLTRFETLRATTTGHRKSHG